MKNREKQRENRRKYKSSKNTLAKCEIKRCVSNQDGKCAILKATDFGDKLCPFYKAKK